MKEILKPKNNGRVVTVFDTSALAAADLKENSQAAALDKLREGNRLLRYAVEPRVHGATITVFVDEEFPEDLMAVGAESSTVSSWQVPSGKIVSGSDEDVAKENGVLRFERMRKLKGIEVKPGSYEVVALTGPKLLEERSLHVVGKLTAAEAMTERVVNFCIGMMVIAGGLSVLAAIIAMVFFIMYGDFPIWLWVPGPFFAVGLLVAWVGTDFKNYKKAEAKRREAAEVFPDVALQLKRIGNAE